MTVDSAKAAILQIPFGPIGDRLARYFVDHYGQWVRTETLVDVAYADDLDGGPDDAKNVIKAHVYCLRKKVAPFGLTIDGHNGGVRRLRAA